MNRTSMFVGAVAASLLVAGAAGAAMMPTTVAGWDFSQYRGSGEMTVDPAGVVYSNTLDPSYSNLVQAAGAPGCGAGAASYGRLYMDSSFGSSLVSPSFGAGDVTPVPVNLDAGRCVTANTAGFPGTACFDTPVCQVGSYHTKVALGPLQNSPTLVFEGDVTPSFPGAGTGGTGWSINFAAKTVPDNACSPNCDNTVSVSISMDGGAFSATVPVVVTPTEDAYSVYFPGTVGKIARVRMTVPTGAGPGPTAIDNVAVNANYVPEPSMLAQIGAGVLGLLGLARRRM